MKKMWLQQQLIDAYKKANNKRKITININFLERTKQRHLKEKYEQIMTVIIKQLVKELTDLNEELESEASLEVTSHCPMNVPGEIQDSMKTLFQIKSQGERSKMAA
ncbi:Ankyrin repeat domain-containing protein 30A [Plecturocebus cupreus]